MRLAAWIAIGAALTGALASIAAPARKASTKNAVAANILRGQQVFEIHCVACHGAGIGNPGLERKPGTDALFAKYEGQEPPVLSDRTDLDPAFITYTVRNGATLMPFFRKTDVSDADLVALNAYLTRNNPK